MNTVINLIGIIGTIGSIKKDNYIIKYMYNIYSNYINSKDYLNEDTLVKEYIYKDLETDDYEEVNLI